ncbi:bifunctional AP-4-A phosphorylase/ADP sulfurylase [Blastocladiella emersonii ATCC 22665]|nr:bifunctional AP-4-A phosphorylase/ADP sulfurylase [Blastocladiella emersonii ATCC 22665]KAI9164355.1 bifunctional AP-4-A phosphorylase/ADP sulfurylase [Blastocladiella emersonii ATCC 22665]
MNTGTSTQVRQRITAAYERGLASGAVVFAPTTVHTIADPTLGVDLNVLVAPSLAKKKTNPDQSASAKDGLLPLAAAAKPPKVNPFLPYEPAMFVADLSPSHVLLLNKFPVISEHVLVVTKEFLPQDQPIDVADMDALIPVMDAFGDSDPLAFYNCGQDSGSSQPHRHIQVFAQTTPAPIDKVIPRHPGASEIPDLPYAHRVTHFEVFPPTGAALHAVYAAQLAALSAALGRAHFPHNVLITRRWLSVIPRRRERTLDTNMGVNAVGYSGSVLVSTEARVTALRASGGVLPVLAELGFPRT